MEKKYSKILISKYSPINKCFIEDGVPLCIKPLKTIPLKSIISHHFVSTIDYKIKSKYGWVMDTEEFELETFIKKYLSLRNLSEIELNTIRLMLDSIEKLNQETPVAATYRCRGIEVQRMDLTVHRVFFY